MATLFPASSAPVSSNPPININPITLLSRPSKFCFLRKPALSNSSHRARHLKNIAPKISCNNDNVNGDANENESGKETSYWSGSRRNVLVGGLSSGLYAATLGSSSGPALADDRDGALEPDVGICYLKDYKGRGPTGEPCCPTQLISQADTITRFTFDDKNNNTTRIRKPAHKLEGDDLNKFREAIDAMKNLPDSDPRSFKQQANVHCAYCDGAYRQKGGPLVDFKVHKSWLFLPFHRAYLYFFERILGKLIGDPTLAIPYWQWDDPDGMKIPSIYIDEFLTLPGFTKYKNPLFDPLRNPCHRTSTIDLMYVGNDNLRPDDKRGTSSIHQDNLKILNIVMEKSKNPVTFLGGSYCKGEGVPKGQGTLEQLPHNLIHKWTGRAADPENGNYGENMGVFYAAARDPIFYAHHANIDRLWSLWKESYIKTEFDDLAWLKTDFVFYDENAKPVKISVEDCLDTEKLGYKYYETDTKKYRWKTVSQGATVEDRAKEVTKEVELDPKTNVLKEPQELKEAFILTGVSVKDVTKDDERVLHIMWDYEKDVFVNFDVCVRYQDGKTSESKYSYLGSFPNLPDRPDKDNPKKKLVDQKLPFPATLLSAIKPQAGGTKKFDLVFHPITECDDVKITSVAIEKAKALNLCKKLPTQSQSS